jgi:hypothetical protein
MFFSKKFLVIALSLFVSFFCYGDSNEESLDEVFFRDFDDDSYFVTIPTYAGNYLGLVIGAIPTALVASGFQFADAEPQEVKEAAKTTLSVFSKPIGLLFGLPFKSLKLLFWDSPKYIYGGISGDTDPPLAVSKEEKEASSY